MQISSPKDEYLGKAKLLTEAEAGYLQAKIRSKLRRPWEDKKLPTIEAMAIQLELEELALMEWRERMSEIRANHSK